jgi:nucleoside-diphosphate-sugar epimerase
MTRILITGIDSPLGQQLATRLNAKGFKILGTSTLPTANRLPAGIVTVPLPDPLAEDDWRKLLDQVSHIIHLDLLSAACATHSQTEIPDIAVTGRLAAAAAVMGVKRFLYLSSVQAMSDHTLPGKPLAWRAAYQPANPFGQAKLESERLVARHCAKAGVEWQIVRVPEIYGLGYDSQLQRLIQLVQKSRVIAIGLQKNQLTYVHLDNLVDAIATAILHPRGGNETLLVSDGDNLSTPELLRYIAHALDRWLILLPVPLFLLRLLRKSEDCSPSEHLVPMHSLAIDDSHTRQALDWQPKHNLSEGIRELVKSLTAKN